MKAQVKEYAANSVICREGEPSSELYFLRSGRLLICTVQGTQVKALATIEAGEFIGELSFFDGRPRSSNIIALEKSTLIEIPKEDVAGLLPQWYQHVGVNLTKKIRLLDQVITETNLRRYTSETKALTIQEQRRFYQALTAAN